MYFATKTFSVLPVTGRTALDNLCKQCLKIWPKFNT